MEGKAEVTNETMTEDVATPHGDDVTDDRVLPDPEAKDELVPGAGDKKTIATLSSRDSHRMCCCDQLGNPSYHPCSASSIQIATANSVPGQIMYCLPCPPCPPVIATLSYYGSANLHWGLSQYVPVHSRAVAGYPIHVSVDASSSLLRITCTT